MGNVPTKIEPSLDIMSECVFCKREIPLRKLYIFYCGEHGLCLNCHLIKVPRYIDDKKIICPLDNAKLAKPIIYNLS